MYDCWNASEKIRAYMIKQGYGTNFALLQQEYETRLLDVAAKSLPGKSLVLYQEVFDEGMTERGFSFQNLCCLILCNAEHTPGNGRAAP